LFFIAEVIIEGYICKVLPGGNMFKRIKLSGAALFIVSVTIAGCQSEQKAVAEENKVVVRRTFDEIWGKGNLDVVDELFSTDVVRHFPPNGSEMKGLDELRDRIHNHRKAFPDWTERVKQIVAEGDFVAFHFTSTGTNHGSFLGNPPTEQQIHINEMSIFRLVDGKIVEQWIIPDLLSLNQQLGLISQSE